MRPRHSKLGFTQKILSSPQTSQFPRKKHKQIALFFKTKWRIYPLQIGTIKGEGKKQAPQDQEFAETAASESVLSSPMESGL
jgi:hypothetical protein